jgi:hypothetical protein
LTLLAGAVCAALTAGVLMAGTALAAVHPDSKQQTQISLALPTPEVTFGQESVADLIVSVPPSPGGPNPTGLVAVESRETGAAVCEMQIPSGATVADCHLGGAFLQPGGYHLFAVYVGDGNYFPADSSASPQSFTVDKQPTTTTLTLPAATLAFDQQGGAVLTFQVTGAIGGTPTGSVSITDGATPICSAVLSNGIGTCALATGELSPGTYPLTATYGADPDFAGSASAPQTLTIIGAHSSTTLRLSASSVTVGHEQAETISIDVTGGVGTPTGAVAISAGSTLLCSSLLSGGAGSCTLTAAQLPPGSYQLTATYGGDGIYAGSTADPQALTVTKVHTSTTLTLSAAKVTFGHEQAERLSVQVTAATGASPTGQVAIKAGATGICIITLANGKGSCTLTASKLAVGTHQLTATYNGDGTHTRSTSPMKTLTVTK